MARGAARRILNALVDAFTEQPLTTDLVYRLDNDALLSQARTPMSRK